MASHRNKLKARRRAKARSKGGEAFFMNKGRQRPLMKTTGIIPQGFEGMSLDFLLAMIGVLNPTRRGKGRR